eukprot:TRINITY_DN0_c175_g1_i11.p2 TRINITY_DN0_c175_g1~~TRINITY_DN0_c175_g1_i11.p2  ORF type:complete len:275 (+),score=62.57 TRINITY_DN0_c175_g1_i11:33-857(+)
MCGPLNLWKWAIYITSFLVAAIGIAVMVVALVIADKEFIKAIEIENLVKAYGIAFGAVLIVVGLIGWLSAKCESSFLVCIHVILMIVITLAFVAVWVVVQVKLGDKKDDVDKICKEVKDSDWLKEIRWMYPKSFCPDTGGSYTVQFAECKALPGSPPSICNGKVKIQDCTDTEKQQIYGANEIPGSTYVKLARYLEDEEGCVGICTSCPYNLYTDCKNSPRKTKSCDEVIVDLIKDYVGVVAGVSAAATVIGCFIIISLFCMCCHKSFNKKTSP